MPRQYSPTLLGYVLLGMLNQTPRSGYDVRIEMINNRVSQFSTSPGSIYPALQLLKKHGLIESEILRHSELKSKEVFNLTNNVKIVLKSWVLKKLTLSDIKDNLPELMLRFRFMESLVSNNETLKFLIDLRRKTKTYTRILKAQFQAETGSSLYRELEFQRELTILDIHNQWATVAIKTFEPA